MDEVRVRASKRFRQLILRLEAISKLGFWFKIKAGPSFNPQAYSRMSRT